MEAPQLFADDEILAPLYSYWVAQCRGRGLPDRRDIDPVAMPVTLLPHLAIVDVVDGGARFRNRLVGTAIVERWGFDTTGRYHDEVMNPGGYSDYIHSLYRDAVQRRAPVYSESVFHWDVHGHLLTRRLYLPLVYGGPDVAMVLVGQTFQGSKISGEPYRDIFDHAEMEQRRRDVLVVAP